MRTATSMKLLAAGLCLWASIAAVSSAAVDSSTIDRIINLEVGFRDDDDKFTKDQYRAALEAQRPCLAESFATVDSSIIELYLKNMELTIKCSAIKEGDDMKEILFCLKQISNIMSDDDEAAHDAFANCDPDLQE